ncbi:acyl-CoA dehydrogenase family protein, partial [bacterium]|nr:acyl-CoA dehydrogenase family protein [bacterium]
MMADRKEKKSFSKCMFAGGIEQEIVFPYPKVDADEAENLKLILESIREFAKDNIAAAAIDREGTIPDEVIKGLAEIGLFGMTIPE